MRLSFPMKKQSFRTHPWIPARDLLEYFMARALGVLVCVLPMDGVAWLARRAGDILFGVLWKRRKVALGNLDRVFGSSKSQAEKKRIARESFRNLVLSIFELVRAPRMARGWEGHFRFQGFENLERAIQSGRGILLVISHLGSWEYLGFLSYRTRPSMVIGRAVRNPHVYRWIQSLRQATLLRYRDKENSAKFILKELKENDLIAIIIDQWAGDEGLWIDFFSQPTSTTSIPARLAKRTGCALIPAYCLRKGSGRYEIRVRPEVPLAEGEDWEARTTRELNRLLEKEITAFPEQWIWLHRRWKD